MSRAQGQTSALPRRISRSSPKPKLPESRPAADNGAMRGVRALEDLLVIFVAEDDDAVLGIVEEALADGGF